MSDSEARTVRVYQKDYKEIMRLADRNDVPVRDVVRELLSIDDGECIGYCPEHGERFEESDAKTRVLGKNFVKCPVKYKSGEARERAHDFNDGDNRIPVEDLADLPPAVAGDEGQGVDGDGGQDVESDASDAESDAESDGAGEDRSDSEDGDSGGENAASEDEGDGAGEDEDAENGGESDESDSDGEDGEDGE